MTLGAAQVNAVIEQCGERGIPVALVVAAGYSEAGEAGAAAEAELAQTARSSGVTLIGPNCMGLVATHSRLHAVGFLELRPQAGRLSIVSQSGNIGVQLVTAAERRGIGIDKYVTVGNEASTSALDVLDALRDDAQTAAALVYLEGVDDGRRFLDVMRRTTRQKPVVVLRGGLTEYGQRAAASHTGAMAGAADVFLAAARQTGCLVRTGPDESLDLALCLTALPLPPGRRVAIMTLGGGWGVLAADELARNDLELALLEPHVLAGLDELLPGYWSRSNPIDLVASVGPDLAERTLTLLAESEAVDAVVVLGVLRSPSTGWTSDDAAPAAGGPGAPGRDRFNPAEIAFLERVTALMESTGKPIVNVPLRPLEVATFPGGARHDPVILYSPVAAVRALAAMAWYAEYVAAQAAPPPRPERAKDGCAVIEITIFGRGGRGGVTLAKLIAAAYFLRGKYVQAFGRLRRGARRRAGPGVRARRRRGDHGPLARPRARPRDRAGRRTHRAGDGPGDGSSGMDRPQLPAGAGRLRERLSRTQRGDPRRVGDRRGLRAGDAGPAHREHRAARGCRRDPGTVARRR